MYEPDYRAVSVATLFGNTYKNVAPFDITWEGKSYRITQVGYRHKYRSAQTVVHVFSATDGINFFELLINTADVRWILGRLKDSVLNTD